MEFVIGGLIAIIVIIIVGLIIRKKMYDQVDYYEDWKLDIMNRNVAGELGRVKALQLEGDTKDRFEHWKNEWDTILGEDMADVEDLLYDTEKAADRYNFPGAKKYMQQMNQKMVHVEEKIERILQQLDELLQIEELNRENVDHIAPKLEDLKKHLTKNSYQYNRAEDRFETEIHDIKEQLKTYELLAEQGNYADGEELVKRLKEKTDQLEVDIEEFPELYKKCKIEMPRRFDELSKGITEMREDGYNVDHLDLPKEIMHYQNQLSDLVKELEESNAEGAKSTLPEMESRIKEIYDLLEQEALAKNYVDSKIPNYEQALEQFSAYFTDTKTQVDKLKEAYYFEDEDLEKYLSLEKKLNKLTEQLNGLQEKVAEKESHTDVKSELETAFEQLKELEEAHEVFREKIHTLRKDELDAREQLEEMFDSMSRINRKLKHSNIPGVPNAIWIILDEARNKNEQVLAALDKQPLDIMEVNQSLQDAKNSTDKAVDQTNTMLEQAYMIEQVIQYANRYRSSYPILHSKLVEAENLFRNAQYELSLEQAAHALEEIEPGALKKVEAHQTLTVS